MKGAEIFKNVDLSKVLSNPRSEYNLAGLKGLANKYKELSNKIKKISNYLYLKENPEEDKSKFSGLENEVMIQEGEYELSTNNMENVKKIISHEYEVSSDNLIRYCKILGSCVEDINEKNKKLEKTIKHSNSSNNMEYNRLVEIITNSSKGLFEEVSKASGIIKKEQLVPNIFDVVKK
ncbi:MAG: hypothetical protein WC393_03590 [Candidatus Nanoarchaeia archaeon]|jgi:hypothetical protein